MNYHYKDVIYSIGDRGQPGVQTDLLPVAWAVLAGGGHDLGLVRTRSLAAAIRATVLCEETGETRFTITIWFLLFLNVPSEVKVFSFLLPPGFSPSKVGRVHVVSHEYALAPLRLKPSSRLCLNLLLSSDVSHRQNLLMRLGLWVFLPRLQADNIPYRSSSSDSASSRSRGHRPSRGRYQPAIGCSVEIKQQQLVFLFSFNHPLLLLNKQKCCR